ncbi:metallophosphoesterase family protein [Zavarzinella formosa]|uniref:metallophosphoesterase family protein n=1 Tax=Zavarzinella formosa TaxID=360055 RepID=UPI00030EAFDB|nr:metallophosphoesterase family protein [Zavarzinella formosa]
MRTLAIGDIHGCLTALDTLLGFIQLKSDDHLIFLGDYIDRGPDSKGVLDRMIQLRLTGQVVTLRGNHELMMLGANEHRAALRSWLYCGGQEALDSYSTFEHQATLKDIPSAHWHFLRQGCLDWYETDTHIFVHANLHYDLPMEHQETSYLQWEFLNPQMFKPHFSGKTMICGHSEQRNGRPLVIPGAVGIDTYAYGDGWLTCLDVATGEYWQTNELGETRMGTLEG